MFARTGFHAYFPTVREPAASRMTPVTGSGQGFPDPTREMPVPPFAAAPCVRHATGTVPRSSSHEIPSEARSTSTFSASPEAVASPVSEKRVFPQASADDVTAIRFPVARSDRSSMASGPIRRGM